MARSIVTTSDLGHWNNLEEGEASKEDGGGHRSRTTAESPTIESQRHQPKIFFPNWDIIFIASSAFSLFVDPLICYIAVIVEKDTCYFWDLPLMWTFLGLRSFTDLFYYMDIVVFLKRFRTKLSAKFFAGASSTKTDDEHLVTTLRNFIHKKPIRFLAILLRIWVALPFLQLYGSMWYLFAVNTELVCWMDYICKQEQRCDVNIYTFYCGYQTQQNNELINISRLKLSCPVELPKNMTSFPHDYGIYLYALQSNVSTSKYLPRKILQCFWWGLRNLSSFGTNLQTSFQTEQIIFSVVISISGLILFLVYLNSRVQGFQKTAEQRILRKKKEKTYPVLIEQRLIVSRLCVDSLKNVPNIGSIDKKGLKAISEHLKPVIYNEDVYIIREGEPLRKMMFIWRGTTLTYTTSKGATNVCKCLEKNDFYGEELVIWALKSASFSELPICTTTLVSQSKVEAFSITANDLKSVVAKFWLHFKRDLPHSQLECFAASSIQIAWRRYHAKKLRDQLAGTSGVFSSFFLPYM